MKSVKDLFYFFKKKNLKMLHKFQCNIFNKTLMPKKFFFLEYIVNILFVSNYKSFYNTNELLILFFFVKINITFFYGDN